MAKPYFVANSIPYVNADPHIGHAFEFVQSDTIARYHRMKGEDAAALSGGDENALKNVQAAEKAGMNVQEFVDKNTERFRELAEALNVKFDFFMKGSDPNHIRSSQKLWELCSAAGDIYKKSYQGLYCIGCEAFYTPDELDANGECFEHPGRPLEVVSEENYFFQLSKYQAQLIELITSDTLKIIPEGKKSEVLAFLREPLQDISISRSNERAKNWGVPVPGDSSQKMYVWFDALNIYQSGVGFGWNDELYRKWWPADVHVIGKGIIRFHAVYWPAFLLSAKLALPKAIFVHGYLTIEGKKMSKTLGNVIDPFVLIEKYGAETLRYYFLREISPTEDGDVSLGKIQEHHNSDLVNNLGNLVARITTLAQKVEPIEISVFDPQASERDIIQKTRVAVENAMKSFKFNQALGEIFAFFDLLNGFITHKEPWNIKDMNELKKIMGESAYLLLKTSYLLEPFLPQTASRIREQIYQEGDQIRVKKAAHLFERVQ